MVKLEFKLADDDVQHTYEILSLKFREYAEDSGATYSEDVVSCRLLDGRGVWEVQKSTLTLLYSGPRRQFHFSALFDECARKKYLAKEIVNDYITIYYWNADENAFHSLATFSLEQHETTNPLLEWYEYLIPLADSAETAVVFSPRGRPLRVVPYKNVYNLRR